MANRSKRLPAEDVASLNLLRLNLHQALISGSEIQQLFLDLNQKYEERFIFDRKYIAESATKIIEILENLIFNLNSLNGAQDIELYFMLDKIRDNMVGVLENMAPVATYANDNQRLPGYNDELSILLGQILRLTAKSVERERGVILSMNSGNITAGELLEICYHKILGFLSEMDWKDWGARVNETSGVNVISLPAYYSDSAMQRGGLDRRENSQMPENIQAGETLINGINEVANLKRYFCHPDISGPEKSYFGVLLRSVDSATFYFRGRNFKYLIAANICNYVEGNYINILSLPSSSKDNLRLRNLMMLELLSWLDFRTFMAGDMIIAAIRNLTRAEINSHLDMLGKLIVFASAPGILMEKESDLQTNIENFLENII